MLLIVLIYLVVYTNIYIVKLPEFSMTDEIQREAEEFFERDATGIVESTAIFENGVLECESSLYNFEISVDYVRAFDKKQDGEEVFYCLRHYSKICQDQALLYGLRAITHMLHELGASRLEKIVGQAVSTFQSESGADNSSLNASFDT